jgi:hypothetical protein
MTRACIAYIYSVVFIQIVIYRFQRVGVTPCPLTYMGFTIYLDLMVKEEKRRRKRRNDGIHNFHSSPSIIRVIELRRMRWTGHVARQRVIRNA